MRWLEAGVVLDNKALKGGHLFAGLKDYFRKSAAVFPVIVGSFSQYHSRYGRCCHRYLQNLGDVGLETARLVQSLEGGKQRASGLHRRLK